MQATHLVVCIYARNWWAQLDVDELQVAPLLEDVDTDVPIDQLCGAGPLPTVVLTSTSTPPSGPAASRGAPVAG